MKKTLFFILLSLSSYAQNPTLIRKGFNPDLSANFLGKFVRGTQLSNDPTQSARNGFVFQEAEIQMTADVDPYSKAMAVFVLANEDGEFAAEPEEVFFETTFIPSLTLKAGKFKLGFGKHNAYHTHVFPFLDAPLIYSELIAEEGINSTGLSAAYLLPASWYSELTVQAFQANHEVLFNKDFDSSINQANPSGEVGTLIKFKNLWDLSDSTTIELGLSLLGGNNRLQGFTAAKGADFTLKWRPTEGGKYQAIIWTTEYLQTHIGNWVDSLTGDSFEDRGGIMSSLQYQFAQRWWIQARAEFLGIPSPQTLSQIQKQSLLLGFYPSEFSGFRVQYDHDKILDSSRENGHTVSLQYNISIGAHPAHAY